MAADRKADRGKADVKDSFNARGSLRERRVKTSPSDVNTRKVEQQPGPKPPRRSTEPTKHPSQGESAGGDVDDTAISIKLLEDRARTAIKDRLRRQGLTVNTSQSISKLAPIQQVQPMADEVPEVPRRSSRRIETIVRPPPQLQQSTASYPVTAEQSSYGSRSDSLTPPAQAHVRTQSSTHSIFIEKSERKRPRQSPSPTQLERRTPSPPQTQEQAGRKSSEVIFRSQLSLQNEARPAPLDVKRKVRRQQIAADDKGKDKPLPIPYTLPLSNIRANATGRSGKRSSPSTSKPVLATHGNGDARGGRHIMSQCSRDSMVIRRPSVPLSKYNSESGRWSPSSVEIHLNDLMQGLEEQLTADRAVLPAVQCSA